MSIIYLEFNFDIFMCFIYFYYGNDNQLFYSEICDDFRHFGIFFVKRLTFVISEMNSKIKLIIIFEFMLRPNNS